MLNINDIGADPLIHAHDHKTPYLIDPWDYLEPKRRKLLDDSWAGLFRKHILSDADAGPEEIALKEPRKILSSSLQNPSDPNAGYDAHKGQGYQVQVMETYCNSKEESLREKTLNLISHVEVEPAHVSDVHALIPALESTKERGLAPQEVLADSLYGSDENREKTKELDVEVISPVMGMPKEETLRLADFPQTDKGKIAA